METESTPLVKEIPIRLISYNKDDVFSADCDDFSELIDYSYIQPDAINWIHLNDLSKKDQIEKLCTYFNLHPLLIEDCLNTEQSPKIEEYESILFFTMKTLAYNTEKSRSEYKHISFILGSNFLISIQDGGNDLFPSIKQSILNDKGKVRKKQSDYLFYLLVDAIVDNYYVVIENFHHRFDTLEEKVVNNIRINLIHPIYKIKKELTIIHRCTFPLREALNEIINNKPDLIDGSNHIYFKDVYDHLDHLVNYLEHFRDMITSLIDLNLSNVNTDMNNVMKRLTAVASIFIPLTFFAGLYGMNFKYMPELEVRWAYPALLACMLTLAISMGVYMKKRKWF